MGARAFVQKIPQLDPPQKKPDPVKETRDPSFTALML